jgi:Sap, sulfolipid-1-addressing protein
VFALLEVPIVAYLINPDRAVSLVNNLSDRVHGNSRTIGFVVAVAVGVWLLTRGIVDLPIRVSHAGSARGVA